MQETELLTKEQVARLLNVRPCTVARWSVEGKLPRIVISPKVIRFNKNEVLKAVRVRNES